MSDTSTSSKSMRTFIVIWIGQLVSLIGSGMTNFGIPIWVFQQTGRATDLTTIAGLFVGSLLLASPFTGVMVDRSNRKLMMMLSDLAAGLTTVVIFVLFLSGNLQIWHLYISAVVQGVFNSFQWPAFSSAISVMLNKSQYTRASSMMQMAEIGSQIFAPIFAGALFGFFPGDQGLKIILAIDVVTFVAAVGTLLFVHVPQPKVTQEHLEAQEGGFFSELTYGFRYILKRPSLLGLQLVFMLGNMVVTVSFALFVPMILLRTNQNALALATVQSIGAVGGIIGGVVISAWGGFKRNVHGVLLGWAFSGIFGTLLIGLGRPVPMLWNIPIVWALGNFLANAIIPLVNGSNQAIWQAKVSPDVQGKVFSIRRVIAWVVTPIATFIAGPLADRVFEPAMQPGGGLFYTFQWLVGTGPGAGMSLTYIFTGLFATAVGLGGYLFPAIRNAEDLLPDHDMVGEVTGEAETVGNAQVEGATA